MTLYYEIKDKKLKELVEKEAEDCNSTVDEVIWRYVNRGLIGDYLHIHDLEPFHAQIDMTKINKDLGLDWKSKKIHK